MTDDTPETSHELLTDQAARVARGRGSACDPTRDAARCGGSARGGSEPRAGVRGGAAE